MKFGINSSNFIENRGISEVIFNKLRIKQGILKESQI